MRESDGTPLTFQLEVSRRYLLDLLETIERTGSAQEVVIVVPRPSGKVLLHTKSFYPRGTYRLPTGRVLPNEPPDDAFRREFREEFGQEGRIDRRLGVLYCKLVSGDDSVEFTSYVYLAREMAEEPRPEDGGEQITGFIETPINELRAVADKLRKLSGTWRDWGRFRAIAHEFVADALSPTPPSRS